MLTAADVHYSGADCSVPAESYVEVASATLAASCLLNAPPGFIEFLLCTPWHQMDLIQVGSDLESLLGVVDITTEQRTQVVNMPLATHLVPVLTDFIYQDRFFSSLPPLLILTHDEQGNPLQPREPPAAPDGEPLAPPVQTWPPVKKAVRTATFPPHFAPVRTSIPTHAPVMPVIKFNPRRPPLYAIMSDVYSMYLQPCYAYWPCADHVQPQKCTLQDCNASARAWLPMLCLPVVLLRIMIRTQCMA